MIYINFQVTWSRVKVKLLIFVTIVLISAQYLKIHMPQSFKIGILIARRNQIFPIIIQVMWSRTSCLSLLQMSAQYLKTFLIIVSILIQTKVAPRGMLTSTDFQVTWSSKSNSWYKSNMLSTPCSSTLFLLLNLVQWLFLKLILIYRSRGHRSKSNC